MRAMNHFHIRGKGTKLMRIYYNDFQTRFTTDWHQLVSGITAGCTLSATWIILIMEMILKAVNFWNNSPLMYNQMNNIIFLSTNKQIMQSGS